MRKNSDGGPEIMVDHEVHEVLDPNSEDKRFPLNTSVCLKCLYTCTCTRILTSTLSVVRH